MLHLAKIRSFIPAILAGAVFCATALFGAEEFVPLKGSASAMITSSTLNPDGTITITAEAWGQATHLGQYHSQLVYTGELGLDENGTLVIFFTGNEVATGANGDELWAEFSAVNDLAGNFWGILQITGGTGRFANATGNTSFTGIDPAEGPFFSYSYEGVISSVGSNKN